MGSASKKTLQAAEQERPDVAAARKAKREQVQTLRSKLLKFVQRIPVFMYLTDFREERLVDVIDQLRAEGMTIIIVEQSLNVAAAVADRAVFLEKGHVKFTGELRELIERDDLARAVFLGAEGG